MITIDSYIDKSKQNAKLLIDYPIQPGWKQKLLNSELKPCEQSSKVIAPTKNIVILSHTSAEVENTITSIFTRDLALSRLNTTINIMMSATKTNSKTYELTRYNEAIINSIHGR